MDRERTTTFPAATDEERALLAALDGASRRRGLRVASPSGASRTLAARLSLEVAAPFDGKAGVLVRLTWEGDAPADDERLEDDAWALLDEFLAAAVADARLRAAAGR